MHAGFVHVHAWIRHTGIAALAFLAGAQIRALQVDELLIRCLGQCGASFRASDRLRPSIPSILVNVGPQAICCIGQSATMHAMLHVSEACMAFATCTLLTTAQVHCAAVPLAVGPWHGKDQWQGTPMKCTHTLVNRCNTANLTWHA